VLYGQCEATDEAGEAVSKNVHMANPEMVFETEDSKVKVQSSTRQLTSKKEKRSNKIFMHQNLTPEERTSNQEVIDRRIERLQSKRRPELGHYQRENSGEACTISSGSISYGSVKTKVFFTKMYV